MKQGSLYLLHFARRYHHAGHYLGWTNLETVEQRVARHLAGHGSPLVAAVVKAGIAVVIAWEAKAPRSEESRLKRWQHNGKLCPICQRAKRSQSSRR